MILLPFRRKSYSGFLRSERNPSSPAGFEPANLGSSGEYDNHWTTRVDKIFFGVSHSHQDEFRIVISLIASPNVCVHCLKFYVATRRWSVRWADHSPQEALRHSCQCKSYIIRISLCQRKLGKNRGTERERETEIQRERQIERQRQRYKYRFEKQRDRNKDRDRERQSEKER